MKDFHEYEFLRRLGLVNFHPSKVLFRRRHDCISSVDSIKRSMYRCFVENNSSSSNKSAKLYSNDEGIFNLAFNSHGSVLVCSCQNKNLLLIDPRTEKLIKNVEYAHSDCVNRSKFIDGHNMLASCSDDKCIAIWDIRKLDQKVNLLQGHSDWVKNIEYSTQTGQLLSSGFDGSIFAWDKNVVQEDKISSQVTATTKRYERVFYTNGLMRMRMTNLEDKLVISTSNGYLLVIHDLSLETLKDDLADFKPNIYRTMQLSGQPISYCLNHNELFEAKRNRVEIISDFPVGNEAESIYSVDLHPQGWLAVTRNTSVDGSSEWLCVHDIHGTYTYREEIESDDQIDSSTNDSSDEDEVASKRIKIEGGGNLSRLANLLRSSYGPVNLDEEHTSTAHETQPDSVNPQIFVVDFRRSTEPMIMTSRDFSERLSTSSTREMEETREGGTPSDRITQISSRISGDTSVSTCPTRNTITFRSDAVARRADVTFGHMIRSSLRGGGVNNDTGQHQRHSLSKRPMKFSRSIRQNKERLTHYYLDKNWDEEGGVYVHESAGFIKEVGFSGDDGRVICSPYNRTVRLFSFDENVNDVGVYYDSNIDRSRYDSTDKSVGEDVREPQKLISIGQLHTKHKSDVLCTAFHPHNFSVVSACMDGSVGFHHPML